MEEETDLIEEMICANCTNSINKDGCFYCKLRKEKSLIDTETGKERAIYESTQPDASCSMWERDEKNTLFGMYNSIIEVIRDFVDTSDENSKIIALWILGTWMHDKFFTFPYLFINAIKGSGKTRLLKLIKELSWKGDMLSGLSDAVLFRTTGTLCIDEFEEVGKKEKNSLREFLNTGYKKGGKVIRMRKVRTNEGEKQVTEEFPTYRPIAMANIWGMEEVLGDRCISIILEKSNNPTITKKMENFEIDPKIQKIKQNLQNSVNWCSLCSVVSKKNIYMEWNNYVNNTTLHTYTTYTTLTTLTTSSDENKTLFNKIFTTDINGRNLELGFPLFLLSWDIGIFDEFLDIYKNIVNLKKADDIMEGRDVMLFSFIEKQTPGEFYKIKQLVNLFKNEIEYGGDDEDRWLSEKWMGRALKRLGLVVDKRRMGEGVEVTLNTEKAKNKLNMFK